VYTHSRCNAPHRIRGRGPLFFLPTPSMIALPPDLSVDSLVRCRSTLSPLNFFTSRQFFLSRIGVLLYPLGRMTLARFFPRSDVSLFSLHPCYPLSKSIERYPLQPPPCTAPVYAPSAAASSPSCLATFRRPEGSNRPRDCF